MIDTNKLSTKTLQTHALDGVFILVFPRVDLYYSTVPRELKFIRLIAQL